MSLDLFAQHYRNVFNEYNQQVLVSQESVIVDPVQIAPKINFLTPEKMWADIHPVLKSNRFYALSLLGPQGTGKTTTASEFGTLAAEDGYRLVYAEPEDFMKDMQGWIEKILEGATDKLFLFLDDLSYSLDTQSRKSSASVKNIIARIRHVFKGRIFLVYGTHRLHAVPPMLRNSGSWIFSSMQSADREDAMKLIAKRKEMRERLESIYMFIGKATIEGPRDGTFTYRVGDQKVSFKWGNEEDPGDGRLMAAFHAGDLKIFQSKVVSNMVDITKYKVDVPVQETIPEAIRDMEIPSNECECQKCGNIWETRLSDVKPGRCPKCHTTLWDCYKDRLKEQIIQEERILPIKPENQIVPI